MKLFKKAKYFLLSVGLVTMHTACSSDDSSLSPDPTIPVIPVDPGKPGESKIEHFGFEKLEIVQSTKFADAKQTEVSPSTGYQMKFKYLAPVQLTLTDEEITFKEQDGTLSTYAVEEKEGVVYVAFDDESQTAFGTYSKDRKSLKVRTVLYDWRGFNEHTFTTVNISGATFGSLTLEQSLTTVEHLEEKKGHFVVGEVSYQLK